MSYRIVIALVIWFLAAWQFAAAQNAGPGQQVEQEFEADGATVPFLIYLPQEYESGESKWPLVLFLHGRGESNGPLNLVAKWGPPMMAARGDPFPFILVSPQCPRDDSWSRPTQQSRLVKLLDWVVKNYAVDEDRVYLTGLSMGGFGSWRLAADHPDRFAAVVPICGGGNPQDADQLAAIPIWVFHGVQDRVVPIQKSVEMVEAIQAAGGERIRFTTLEHMGHNSWSAAYGSPELYQWLTDQKRARAPAP